MMLIKKEEMELGMNRLMFCCNRFLCLFGCIAFCLMLIKKEEMELGMNRLMFCCNRFMFVWLHAFCFLARLSF